jgi:hypothetical protein
MNRLVHSCGLILLCLFVAKILLFFFAACVEWRFGSIFHAWLMGLRRWRLGWRRWPRVFMGVGGCWDQWELSAVVQREPLRLAMSPSGVDKGELAAEQLLSIDEHARIVSQHAGKPSDESLLH